MRKWSKQKKTFQMGLEVHGMLEGYSAVYRTLQSKWIDGSERRWWWLCLLLADSLCGLLVLSLVADASLHERLWPWVDERIADLDRLIEWLTQNPAGLKLNEPLNRFLARFFRYHIYLWQTFMRVVRSPLLWQAVLASLVLGLSVAIAAVADFFVLLTVHIKCFEIYANRLGRVTASAGVAFWRFLRGKKWDPLRQRVDSIQLDARQLFVATCLALLVLFLAPTVAVYFTVFTALSLAVSCVQAVLHALATFHSFSLRLLEKSSEDKEKAE